MNYNEIRRKTKKLKIGNIYIGGDAPIAIQSMTNTDTCDKEATLEQIIRLQAAGCDIVRITVPSIEAAQTIPYLKENGIYTKEKTGSLDPEYRGTRETPWETGWTTIQA